MLPSTLHIILPMHVQSLKLLYPMVKEKLHLQEKTLFYPDLGVKVMQNVDQYPLHHVTCAYAKFEVATSNSLGGNAFTRKYMILTLTLGQGHMNLCPIPSTSCELKTFEVAMSSS